MYALSGYRPEQVTLATQRVPRDVMLEPRRDIHLREVDPVIVWRVGWRGEAAWYGRLREEGDKARLQPGALTVPFSTRSGYPYTIKPRVFRRARAWPWALPMPT